MNDDIIDTEKYSMIVLEIERFINAEKEKPTVFHGIVEKIDPSNNVLSIRLHSIIKPALSVGSTILLREDSALALRDICAIVKGSFNSIVKIEIRTDPSRFENSKVVIDISQTNVILNRLEEIIKKIKDGAITSHNARILDFMIGDNAPRYTKERVRFISNKLNENQKEAVMKAVSTEDFHLIKGPPGTGKTFVIEELVGQFFKRNKKLLITAWTNLAVDNMVRRIIKKGMEIVRMGPLGEIHPEVKKYSIFEKMKEHKEWKDVERCRKIIDALKIKIPGADDEIESVQKNIERTLSVVKSLDMERGNLANEMEKYKLRIVEAEDNGFVADCSSINEDIAALCQKSETFLSLSRSILQMNELQAKIPEENDIQNLKRQIRSMRFSILGKKAYSFLSGNKGPIENLKREYENSVKYLNEITELQKKYNDLNKICGREFFRKYSIGEGHPDEDALRLEFEIYNLLENKYLPAFREQETANYKYFSFCINQEVYKIYTESIARQIKLIDIKIRYFNMELHTQITRRNELYGFRTNLSFSLKQMKINVDRLIRSIIHDILDDADLIAATAVSSDHYFLDDTEFDVMIMDEASQVASFMSLLPLFKCKKFILVGDDKQLQPIEEENISEDMNLSIFNRLLEKYPYASTLLIIQYRMHKDIAQIASEIFYEGKLKTSEEVAEKILELNSGNHRLLNPKPKVFIDTSRRGYYEDEVGSGCSNTKEAEYVVCIVSTFVKNRIKPEDIGVITPYVKQKDMINEFLKDIKIKDVEVDTVHKFQGREKDIIIVSFARSKRYPFPPHKLRFIENGTLINVAITRPKKKLILIGNSGTLHQSKLLEQVINKIGKENTIVL